MKKPGLFSLILAFVAFLGLIQTPPARAASYVWTNAAGGNWNVAANWSPNGVPGGSDTAAVSSTGSYTVLINDTEAIGTLTLGASTLDTNVQTLNLAGGALTINNPSTGTAQGTLNVSSGNLAGPGALVLAGPLNWTGGAIEGTVQFNGGSVNGGLNLYGALINSGTLVWSGALYMYGGMLTNLASGTINISAGATTQGEGGLPDLENDGQFNVSGPGTANIGIPFNNSGTVAVTGGTLILGNTGTESGSFTVASGATLSLGSTLTFNSSSTISGDGNLTVSGTVSLGGICNVTGTNTFSGGEADVTGAYSVTNTLVISGGTLNLNGTGTITPASATISGGTEEGSQVMLITNTDAFTWTGGAVAGTVQFNGGSVNGGLNLYGALINSGTLVWNGALYMYGGTLTNLASGTINMGPGTSTQNEGGLPDLENDGQLNVSGPGTANIGIPFNNSGTVAVAGGTLILGNTGTESGSFTVASGATLGLSGALTFTSSSTISGDGNLTVSGTVGLGGTCNLTGTNTFSGGVANVTGAYSVTNTLVISGGTLNLNGTGAVTPALATISSGTEEGSQPMQVTSSGGFTWNGGIVAGTVQFNGGSVNGGLNLYGALINSGPLVWNGTLYMYGGTLTNLASGTINMGPGTSTQNEGGLPDLENDGQFNVSGPGTSTIAIPFINTGTVSIQSGTLNAAGGYTSTNGTLNFGIVSTNSFGTLTLAGPVALNGTLGAIANGYVPNEGDTFPLISYGSETGIFNAFNFPPNAGWGFNYGQTDFSITVNTVNSTTLTLQAITPYQSATGFTLLMLGPIGSNYALQAASDPILANWVTLTNFTSVHSSFYYTDTTTTNYPARVFRAVLK